MFGFQAHGHSSTLRGCVVVSLSYSSCVGPPFFLFLVALFLGFFRVGEKDNVDFPLKKEKKIKKRNKMWEKPKT